MAQEWSQATIQQYIQDEQEENISLNYKAADSLGKSDGKKNEISKDVSAMANSAGGLIIYGVREYQDEARKHKPEILDPVVGTEITKEWLEQVINSNIHPRIEGLLIHPVRLDSGPNHAAYVVEIPQSTTAHQAKDKRYYKRYNFESVPMEDYEVRQTMNRATIPDIEVRFSHTLYGSGGSDNKRIYQLAIELINIGTVVVKNWRLIFSVPGGFVQAQSTQNIRGKQNMSLRRTEGDHRWVITYSSRDVLFPDETREIGHEFEWRYEINNSLSLKIMQDEEQAGEYTLFWTLYADNMPHRTGNVSFVELYDTESHITA
jgi:hypothetical protein